LDEDGRRRIASRSASRHLPEADDVASVVEYLLGEGGRNVTGTVVTVDAGSTA
jgi:3-oxoacyl-[acyl-carrier protein] reductase